ncbi:MAG: O-succinylhomoserine sulfhydrylase [Proteobacteria bacterium]|nr:O-succinylhomoserine sulfhydrylase [Pseudomonadota bacterium]
MSIGKNDQQRNETADWRLNTRLVRGGTVRSQHGETSEALFMTSGYVYTCAEEAEARFRGTDDGYIYSRYGNPTVRMFEERMMLLEGAEDARATASGMAAVNAALMCQLKAGDHVVAARALFGSCLMIIQSFLPRYGIEITLVDGADLDQWRAAIRPETVCAFLESPSNPGLELVDIPAVAELLNAVGARLIVDNVFATPILQKPLELGADIVVYSTTKHIDGQGRAMGGIVLCDAEFCEKLLVPYYRHTGPSMSPFNAWVMLKGLETLELRIARHCENATKLADFLSTHAEVQAVRFPGLPNHPQYALAQKQMKGPGTVVSFELGGDKQRAFRFLNSLRMVNISNNLGDAKSLMTHPATTTHYRLTPEERAQLGISDSFVRISVGLEDVEDIKEDLDQALRAT